MSETTSAAPLYLPASVVERIPLALPSWRSVSDIWKFLDDDQPYYGVLPLATSIGVLQTGVWSASLQRKGAIVDSVRTPDERSGIVRFSSTRRRWANGWRRPVSSRPIGVREFGCHRTATTPPTRSTLSSRCSNLDLPSINLTELLGNTDGIMVILRRRLTE